MNCAFEFTRPVDDYASDAMIKLWYSWAQYYLAHWKDKTPSAPTAFDTDHRVHPGEYSDDVPQPTARRAGQRHAGSAKVRTTPMTEKGRPSG